MVLLEITLLVPTLARIPNNVGLPVVAVEVIELIVLLVIVNPLITVVNDVPIPLAIVLSAEDVNVIELLSTNAWLTEPFTVKSIPVIEIEPVLMLMLLFEAVIFPLLKYKPFETPELVPAIEIVLLLTVFGVEAFPS